MLTVAVPLKDGVSKVCVKVVGMMFAQMRKLQSRSRLKYQLWEYEPKDLDALIVGEAFIILTLNI